MGNKTESPIFIGGLDRSGKTTLQAFLATHPKIAIPVVGSNLWTYFYRRFGDLGISENFERCLDALLHSTHVLDMHPDVGRLRQEFWQGVPSYARLFGLLHQHYADYIGKPRWGDQTGLLEICAGEVLTAYPGAKMIHMVRDPRDRYQASLEMWPEGRGKVGGATARWIYSVAHAFRNKNRYPDRYLIVHFEDLVKSTEETLRKICTFINEDYDPRMLTMDASPGHREKLRKSSNRSTDTHPLSAQFIGRYSLALPDTDIAFIQDHAGKQMRAMGYSLDRIHFSVRKLLAYNLVQRPVNLGRMLAWQVMETAHTQFPRIAGRKLPSHKITDPKLPHEDAVVKVVDKISVPASSADRPIFLGGLDRTGKTLLSAMLNGHPNLVITRRTYLWTRFYNRFGDLDQPENFERCLSALLAYKAIRDFQPDSERIRSEFLQGPQTYGRLFSLFHKEHAQAVGKSRWGDQLGLVESYAPEIFTDFPEARMIHMIRNPRSRYEAALDGKGSRKGKVGWSLAKWEFSARLARCNLAAFPNRYKVIQYESLVAEPEQTLADVCCFIGEEFVPEMLSAFFIPSAGPGLHADGQDSSGSSHGTTAGIPSPAELTRGETLFIEKIARRSLDSFGYPPASPTLTFPERLQYLLVDYPVNSLAMLTWNQVEGRRLHPNHPNSGD